MGENCKVDRYTVQPEAVLFVLIISFTVLNKKAGKWCHYFFSLDGLKTPLKCMLHHLFLQVLLCLTKLKWRFFRERHQWAKCSSKENFQGIWNRRPAWGKMTLAVIEQFLVLWAISTLLMGAPSACRGVGMGCVIGGCVWEYVCVSMFLSVSLYKYLFVCESGVLLISPSLSISFRSLFIYLFFLFFVLIAGLETHQYLILFLFLSFSSHQSTLLMSPTSTFLEKLNLTSYISGETFKLFPVIRDSFIITGWKIRGKENIMIERKP